MLPREQHIAKQHRIIAKLEKDGHDTRVAREFLVELESLQKVQAKRLELNRMGCDRIGEMPRHLS